MVNNYSTNEIDTSHQLKFGHAFIEESKEPKLIIKKPGNDAFLSRNNMSTNFDSHDNPMIKITQMDEQSTKGFKLEDSSVENRDKLNLF
jgi:hypothetical protein